MGEVSESLGVPSLPSVIARSAERDEAIHLIPQFRGKSAVGLLALRLHDDRHGEDVFCLPDGEPEKWHLYVGVTNSLERRVWQHKLGTGDSFTHRYRVNQLVYLESFRDVSLAIAREKQLKAGPRRKKIALIERENPDWIDLSKDWFS